MSGGIKTVWSPLNWLPQNSIRVALWIAKVVVSPSTLFETKMDGIGKTHFIKQNACWSLGLNK